MLTLVFLNQAFRYIQYIFDRLLRWNIRTCSTFWYFIKSELEEAENKIGDCILSGTIIYEILYKKYQKKRKGQTLYMKAKEHPFLYHLCDVVQWCKGQKNYNECWVLTYVHIFF